MGAQIMEMNIENRTVTALDILDNLQCQFHIAHYNSCANSTGATVAIPRHQDGVKEYAIHA